MVRLLREAMALLDRIERSQRTWPDPKPNETREIFDSLDHVVAALHQLRAAVLEADDDATERSSRDALWQAMMSVGAACSPPPPYPRPARGRPPGALLVVHAAHHYFALSGTEATAQDLAMVCALEPDADFGWAHVTSTAPAAVETRRSATGQTGCATTPGRRRRRGERKTAPSAFTPLRATGIPRYAGVDVPGPELDLRNVAASRW
ncbi:MAG: hypothetical protein M5U28_14185 [Sandaracinaceae bacterium]|nr:hypothetical protein [Sandaracinaceae bacterium]